eukprot:m.139476 g.139476  ORF g.139476 m.139476 type:complete len:428 (+) comp14801_c0_seq3:217-1500(+)
MFSASSKNIRLDRNTLVATCRNREGQDVTSQLNLDTGLGNKNGEFEAGGQNYSQTARNQTFQVPQTLLSCELQCCDGSWRPARIKLDDVITNDDGKLKFVDPVSSVAPTAATEDNSPLPNQSQLPATNTTFLDRLARTWKMQDMYKSSSNQAKARAVIPIKELEQNAALRSDPGLGQRDYLLKELLNWFKTNFFTWVDTLPCQVCGKKTKTERMLQPTNDDLRFGAQRVEGHLCTENPSHGHTRFPRYNDPVKLLESRRGRCGEWANCFVLCAASLGFEVRYILDFEDHVWAEAHSDHLQRWIHCDPCENAFDAPMMYETGWGKKLSYVFAFSTEEVRDVTWRYSKKTKQTMRKRTQYQEGPLAAAMLQINERKRKDEQTRRKLDRRHVRELVEFVSKQTYLRPEETRGRQTGSLEWRRERGELGSS